MSEFETLLISDYDEKAGNEIDHKLFEEENGFYYEMSALADDHNYEIIDPQEYFDDTPAMDEHQNDSIFYANETPDENTICPICSKQLSSPSNLKNHIKKIHELKEFICDHCSKKFRSKNNLRLHMYHHRKYFEVECHACKRKYKTIQSLRYHLRQHFESYQCDFCDRIFELKKLLYSHLASYHDRNERFSCNFCTRTFSRNDLRDAHERAVHETGTTESGFICDECGASFNYRSALIEHSVLTHSEEKEKVQSCDVCGKICQTKAALASHLNVHEEKSEFSCEKCMQTFTYKANLMKHHRMKRCKGVAKTKFPRDDQTKQQMAAVAKQQFLEISVNPSHITESLMAESVYSEFEMLHATDDDDAIFEEDETIFDAINSEFLNDAASIETTLLICDICGDTFNQKNELIKHIRKLHYVKVSKKQVVKYKNKTARSFQCTHCGKMFKRNCEMLNHEKSVHATVKVYVECEICHKVLLEKSLKSHIINQHTDKANYKPFECNICGKRVRYERTLQIHMNSLHNPLSRGTIYECPECPATFFRSRDLSVHSFEHFTGNVFVCGECGKKFKQKRDFNNHMHIHDGRTFTCTQCTSTYKSKNGLSKHFKNKHC